MTDFPEWLPDETDDEVGVVAIEAVVGLLVAADGKEAALRPQANPLAKVEAAAAPGTALAAQLLV